MIEREEHSPSDSRSPLSSEVLERIKTEGIAPVPRWRFLLKDSVMWGTFAVSCLIGMTAVAAALFVLANSGFRFYLATHDNFLTFFFDVMPVMWILALAAFVGIGYYHFRHTKRGYRYPLIAVIAFSILLSVAGGTALYGMGIGKIVEEKIGGRIHGPLYVMQKEWWVRPERGLLAGERLSNALPPEVMVLRAFDGTVWHIETTDLREPDVRMLEESSLVRVIGVPLAPTSSGEVVFHACFIFPWDIPSPPEFTDAMPRRFEGAKHTSHGTMDRSSKCQEVRPYIPMQRLQEMEAR